MSNSRPTLLLVVLTMALIYGVIGGPRLYGSTSLLYVVNGSVYVATDAIAIGLDGDKLATLRCKCVIAEENAVFAPVGLLAWDEPGEPTFDAFQLLANLTRQPTDGTSIGKLYAKSAAVALQEIWSHSSQLRGKILREANGIQHPAIESFMMISRHTRDTLIIEVADLDIDLQTDTVYVRWLEPMIVGENSSLALLKLGWTKTLPDSKEIWQRASKVGIVAALSQTLEREAQVEPTRASLPIAVLKVSHQGNYSWVLKGACNPDPNGAAKLGHRLEFNGRRLITQ